MCDSACTPAEREHGVAQQLIRFDVPLLIAASALVLLIGARRGGRADRRSGAVRRDRRLHGVPDPPEPPRVRSGGRRVRRGVRCGGRACPAAGQRRAGAGGAGPAGGGRTMAGRGRGHHRDRTRRQRAGHRPDHLRGRNLAAGSSDLGAGRYPRRARHRRRQRDRQLHLQPARCSAWAASWRPPGSP
jgi:hypothetical protein